MGEYEPNDSRNVTGANNKAGQNEGNPNTNQGGDHWKQQQQGGGSGGQQGSGQQGQEVSGGPISQSSLQDHGNDPGMRHPWMSEQAGGQQQGQQAAEGGRSPGQMGQQSGNAQMGGGSGGQQQQFQDRSGQMGGQSGGATGQTGAMGNVRGQLREHMEVIGADGVHVGTIDSIEGDRIKLTRKDSSAGYEGGQHTGHHHYLPLGLVAEVEGDTVRLSANADVAYGMEQEKDEE